MQDSLTPRPMSSCCGESVKHCLCYECRKGYDLQNKCTKCGKHCNTVQTPSTLEQKTCPRCGKGKLWADAGKPDLRCDVCTGNPFAYAPAQKDTNPQVSNDSEKDANLMDRIDWLSSRNEVLEGEKARMKETLSNLLEFAKRQWGDLPDFYEFPDTKNASDALSSLS